MGGRHAVALPAWLIGMAWGSDGSVGELEAASRRERPLLGIHANVSGNEVAHRHELHSIRADLDAVADAPVLAT